MNSSAASFISIFNFYNLFKITRTHLRPTLPQQKINLWVLSITIEFAQIKSQKFIGQPVDRQYKLVRMLQNRTSQIIVGGVTVMSLSYLSYRMWKRYFSDPKIKPQKEQDRKDNHRVKTTNSSYSDYYFDKQEELRKIVFLISDKGPTIEDVYLLSPRILVDQYLKYTQEIRKRRRLIRKFNEDQYIAIVRNYDHEIKELLHRGRLELLQEFGQTADDLQRMERGFEMFENLQDLKKKALIELKKQTAGEKRGKRIASSKLRKIMEEEISFIKNRMHERIRQKLLDDQTGVSSEEILSVVTNLIDDVICEKYGYEREEIERQINELPLLAKELNKHRKMLFAEIGQFHLYSLNSDDDEGSESEGEANIKNGGSEDFQTEILEESLENSNLKK